MLEALALLRRVWWAPVILGLSLALFVTRGTLKDLRASVAIEKANQARQSAELQAANADKARVAADTYAQRTAALQPLILRSVDKVTTYAQTPAGRAPCLAADRVSSILDDRAGLFAFTSSRSAEPVPAGPTLPYDPVER